MKNQVEQIKLTIQQDIQKLEKENALMDNLLRIDTLKKVLGIIDDIDGTNIIGKWGYFWDDDDDLSEKTVFAYSKLIDINFNSTSNTFQAANGFYDHFSLTPPVTN
jgi:hypothetical protein